MLHTDPSKTAISKSKERKARETDLAFDKEYNVIIMIQAKNFEGSVWDEVRNSAVATFENNKIKDYFFGISFGRFNYSVEFLCSSVKVASNIAINLQNNIKKALRKEWQKAEVCSSVVFGTEVLTTAKLSSRYDQAVRTYSFVRPRDGKLLPFVKVASTLNSKEPRQAQMKVLWTHGVHWVLITSGPCFDSILSKFSLFRFKARRHYLETSTCVSLNYKEGFFDGQEETTEEHKHFPKYAVVYIKQSRIGPLKLGTLRPLKPFPDLLAQMKRLGGSDTVLMFKEETLGKIMLDLFELRKNNWAKLSHTATVLIYGDRK